MRQAGPHGDAEDMRHSQIAPGEGSRSARSSCCYHKVVVRLSWYSTIIICRNEPQHLPVKGVAVQPPQAVEEGVGGAEIGHPARPFPSSTS
jgi:hypothetical protein